MTQRLYYDDAYISQFEATVTKRWEEGELYAYILDKTAFFPTAGGQEHDIGTLNGANVIDVKEHNGEIVHYLADAISTDAVKGQIDFSLRFDKMQNHSGEHIVSGLVHSLFGFENVGFHLGKEQMTMDYSGVLSHKDVRLIEEKANEAIYKNLPIKCYFPENPEEISYRSKLDLKENIRLVEIEGIDICACCAPHVRRTGEIGVIKIVDFYKYKGGTRMFAYCGKRCLNYVFNICDNNTQISRLLKAKPDLTAHAVEQLFERNEKNEYDLKGTKSALLKLECEKIDAGEYPHIFVDEPSLLKDAACILAKKATKASFAFFSGTDGLKLMAVSENSRLKELSGFFEAIHFKGGIRDDVAQGCANTSAEEVEKILDKL